MTTRSEAPDITPEDQQPIDAFGASDLVSRVLAVLVVCATIAVAIAATVGWTIWVTGFLPGLGYATVPACLYVLSIGLIPALGIAHRLWVRGDVVKRAEDVKRHERDRLRTTLLHASGPTRPARKSHAYELPDNFFQAESDEDARRRRREARDAQPEGSSDTAAAQPTPVKRP